MTVQELMDLAKAKQNLRSDLALSRKLELSQGTIWKWRVGEALPNPSHTRKLAELAGVDAGPAIIEIMSQGEKDPATKKVFEAIQKCVTAAAAAIVLTALPLSESTASSMSMIYQEYTLCAVVLMRLTAIVRRYSSWITRTCQWIGTVGASTTTVTWCRLQATDSAPA